MLTIWSGAGARAADVDLRFSVIGQGYQTRTAGGDFLDRRRLIEWVDLRAGRLMGFRDLSFEASFRLNSELGFGDDLEAMGNDQVELMLARVRLRKLAGRLDLTAGRQMLLDELDFLLFDGLRADLHMPAGLTLKLISGFEVRGRSLLGGGEFELDGVEDESSPAPLVGAGLCFDSNMLRAELAYRRMLLWAEGWPLLEERLGASAALDVWRKRIGIRAGAVFDLIEDQWDRLRASASIRLPAFLEGVRFEAGYLRSRPHFSLDSIFNFFSPAPFSEVRAGLGWYPRPAGLPPMSFRLGYTRRDYLAVSGGQTQTDSIGDAVSGIDFEGRLWTASGISASLVGDYEDGAAGRRWLVAPGAVFELADRRLIIDGRAIGMSFDDPLQANQDALTLGCSAGLTWRFASQRAIVVMGQLNGNRINPLRLRLMVVLDLAFQFNPGRIFR